MQHFSDVHEHLTFCFVWRHVCIEEEEEEEEGFSHGVVVTESGMCAMSRMKRICPGATGDGLCITTHSTRSASRVSTKDCCEAVCQAQDAKLQ